LLFDQAKPTLPDECLVVAFICKISLEHEATEGAGNFGRLPAVDSMLEMEAYLSG
jgi:hypothetical protein